MSLSRLNRLVMSGVLPFNHSMDHACWCKFYDDHPTFRDPLCPNDPREWPPERIDEVNKTAEAEAHLLDRLMALPQAEFNAEVRRLEKESGE